MYVQQCDLYVQASACWCGFILVPFPALDLLVSLGILRAVDALELARPSPSPRASPRLRDRARAQQRRLAQRLPLEVELLLFFSLAQWARVCSVHRLGSGQHRGSSARWLIHIHSRSGSSPPRRITFCQR